MASLTRQPPLLILLLILLIVSLPTLVTAQEGDTPPPASAPLILSDDQGEYPLGLHLEILEDPTAQLTIEEIISSEYQRQFVPSQEAIPNFGLTNAAYWVRFRVRNEASQTEEWRLEMSLPGMNFIDLYTPLPAEAGFGVKRAGLFLPFAEREVAHHHFVFKLPLAFQSEETVYLRFESGGGMILPLTLWSPSALAQKNLTEQFIIGLFYGVVVVMIGYNAFLLASLRDKSYLYLVLQITVRLLLLAEIDGRANQFLWPDLGAGNRWMVPLLFGLSLILTLKFATTFLETKQFTPKWHTFLTLLMVGLGLLLLLIPFVRYGFILSLLLALALPVLVIDLVMGVVMWQRGYRPARFFVLAELIPALVNIIEVSIRFDLLPDSAIFALNQPFGVALRVLLLSLALADRINLLKRETEQANRKLRESESRLTQFLEAMPVGVAVYDAQANLEYTNQKTRQIFNVLHRPLPPTLASHPSLTTVISQFPLFLAGTAQPYPLERLPLMQALNGQSSTADDVEVEIAGQRVALEMWAHPVFDEQGRVQYAVSAFQDISERKQAEAQVHYQANLLQNVSEAIISADLDFRIQSWNQAAAQIYGYTAAEALGQPVGPLLNTTYLNHEQSAEVVRVFWEKGFWQGEVSQMTKDGHPLHIHASVSRLKDGLGQAIGAVSINRDITERKQVGARLQQYTQRLEILRQIDRAILQSQSPQAIAEAILTHLAGLVTYDRASVVLFDDETDEGLFLAASVKGETTIGGGKRLPRSAFWLSESLQQGQVAIVEDLASLSQLTQTGQILLTEGIRSILVAPLLVEGDFIGIFNLGAKQTHAFSLEHAQIIREIANPLAITIQQSRLREQIQGHTAELEQRVAARTAELRQSEALLQSLVENAPLGILVRDSQERYTLVNPLAAAWVGSTPAEMLGRTMTELSPPDILPLAQQQDQEVLTHNKLITAEVKIFLSGKVRTYYRLKFPIRGEQGEVYGVGTMILDISERKQAEEALQQAHDELAHRISELATLNHITQLLTTLTELPAILSVVARQTVYLLAAFSAEMWLFNETGSAGTLTAQYHTQDDDHLPGLGQVVVFREADRAYLDVLNQGQSVVIPDPPLALDSPAGSNFIRAKYLSNLMLIPLHLQGKTLGFMAIATNAVGRQFTPAEVSLAEIVASQVVVALENTRLFEQEWQQRHIAQSLQGIAVLLNSQMETEAVLTGIIKYLWAVVTYDSAGLFLQEGADLVLRGGGRLDPALLGQAIPLTSPNPTVTPYREKRVVIENDIRANPDWWTGWPEADKAGQQIKSWMGAPLLVGEAAIGVLTADSFVLNRYSESDGQTLQLFASQAALAIHNARLYEQAQEARQVAEAASQAKTTFLASMSHELRTPLNGILGYAQILQQDAALTPTQLERLAIMQRSGEHLLTLINDILDIAKIEVGKLELDQTTFYFPTFLRDIADIIRLQTEDKNNLLLLEPFDFTQPTPTDQLPAVVRGDEKRLRQVLINLLGNAVKFTEGGQVIFRVSQMVTGLEGQTTSQQTDQAPDIIRFEVEDTGPGIPPEQLETIFEPFQQARETKPHIEGTGLGLTICRNLVEMMGGKLRVVSILGQGSLFWFDVFLPEIVQDGVINPGNGWPEDDPRGLPVLLVDLTLPPPEELAVLQELAILGDIRAIRQRVAHLASANPQLQPFAQEVTRLVKGFQINKLQELLKQWLEP